MIDGVCPYGAMVTKWSWKSMASWGARIFRVLGWLTKIIKMDDLFESILICGRDATTR